MPLRLLYVLLALAIFLLEVFIATQLRQFDFIRGSLGDFLVVGLIYFVVQACWPCPSRQLAIGVFVFSIAVEISQYFHLADALHFAKGSWQHIVLGNVFSWGDILMYLLGCIAVYAFDLALIRRMRAS